MILLSQTAFSVLNWIITIAFVIINVYITANILRIYGTIFFKKDTAEKK